MDDSVLSGEALNKAFLEHREILAAFCLALLRDRCDGEEVFQEVGLSVIEAAAKGEAVRSFLPWAREICRRRAADHLRRKRRRERREHSFEEMGEIVERAFSENEDLEPTFSSAAFSVLDDCLGKLGPRARSIVDSFYHGRLAIAAIAERIGWKADAVKVALCKARRSLLECFRRHAGSTDA